MIAALKSDVKLSAGQTKDVDEAVGDLRKSLMGLGEMDPAERRARFRAARDELVTRISAVLNSEQRSTFDGIRERFAEDAARGGQPARIFLLGDDGEPKGVSIRLGASDGGMTEVISGAVEAGRDAIIGGGPRTGGARPPGGRRFGL
jgi:HlyD family secretion protein